MAGTTISTATEKLRKKLEIHGGTVGFKYNPPALVTPYLPDDARLAMTTYERSMKQPVFVRALEVIGNACPNCGGIGFVFLRFAKAGPFRDPPGTREVIFWLDGDGRCGKGWYIQHESKEYECPECHNGKGGQR